MKWLTVVVLALAFCITSSAFAGTTSGTFVKLQDSAEGNTDFIVKNQKGKNEVFDIGSEGSNIKQWQDKSAKGKKVIIHWKEEGVNPYKFKTITKIE